MGPFPVVIGAPHLQQASQVAFTQRDRPVKTLAPQGANQSLTKRICFRAPVRCFQHSEPQVGDRRIERLSKDTVSSSFAILSWPHSKLSRDISRIKRRRDEGERVASIQNTKEIGILP